ncbi:uncharacterized protein si:dkey-262k9.2 isoform X2 [Thunnus albacares]|uniref:uncharacterized protein si:dkey-262k9.2 isoform X2 n=1 Tax=Thunnus albacares TaxID=8236 RepID=UPI001CF611EA|nr:uncharacterized protein si:dkey-262k9.2 isoform X2 [Thunnus albacares]
MASRFQETACDSGFDNRIREQHLKMMRLLFLCLLLPAATAFSEEGEGSAVGALDDDEDLFDQKVDSGILTKGDPGSVVGKTTGAEDTSDQFTLIVTVVGVTVLTLSVAAVVTIMLVRRHMHNRQQGIYSVPTEQDQKGAV